MKFNEHGNFQVSCDRDIIYYKVVGMWNKEASLNCIEQLRKCFKNRADLPVAMIVDTIEFEGGIQEAFQSWEQEFHFWHENNLTTFIRIDDQSSIHYRLFLANIDERLEKNIHFEVASDFSEAVNIAHKLGFSGF